jgi:hypothetical protein
MEDTKATPVMFDHCLLVYEKMAAEAIVDEDGDLMYEGHTTKLFQTLGLPAPYYSSIMPHLKAMGCVEHVRRGGGNAFSIWRMVTPPTEDSFQSMVTLKRPKRDKFAQLEQQLKDLRDRISALETNDNLRTSSTLSSL